MDNRTNKLISRLYAKYKLQVDDIEETIELAISEYNRLSNSNITSLEEVSNDVFVWIKKVCYEILDRNILGIRGGVHSLSENGFSVQTDGNIISMSLQSEIIPNVDYPK